MDVYLMDKNRWCAQTSDHQQRQRNANGVHRQQPRAVYISRYANSKVYLLASGTFPQTYEVGIDASRPRLYSPMTMYDVSIRSNGDILYHDAKGYEDNFRKHHRSPVTRDIWLYSKGNYSKLTDFNGEDRTPVWAGNDNAYYYLSEEDGTFNVYKRNIDGSGKKQLTFHKKNPVRFLTVANNGTLCYGYDGEIYTLKRGRAAKEGEHKTLLPTK